MWVVLDLSTSATIMSCHSCHGRTRPGLGGGGSGALASFGRGKVPTRPQEGGKARVRLATRKDAKCIGWESLVQDARAMVTIGGLGASRGTFVTNGKAPTTLKIRLPPRIASGGQAINGAHPWFRGLRAAGSRRFGTGIYNMVTTNVVDTCRSYAGEQFPICT
ncbi:hypothetical protein MCOR24_009521 [Pyricularia oryzae]|uniref:Uncharacterized protein n=1 Tax=Pyricularia oryzae TaxID=318829 RepID=A0A4P7MV62_PYROR|nr:hypothetical protein MCOR24_009521 [Pyricularia oryzae]QBZ53938.1 hypothetical protein PoMZ_09628 [Pyricularia oryzae]